uniref:HTR5B n=2 Tax=Poeciliopsis prolifica TaxID=188132 RepID=A0A0S7EW47_9TELE
MKIKKEAEAKPAKPVRRGDEDEDEDDLGADVLPPDSLITLVQPELPSLSRLWLAMLRDYALLTLPAEFSSQLPPDGGAFYTPETIDTARLHYRSSWAPVLHAVALWLNSNGFEVNDNQEDHSLTPSKVPNALQGSSSSAKMLEDSVKDRMHLMLGVSIEFLCFPRPEEPIEHVMSCLQALSTLLETPCAKTHMAEDQLLAVELLNVLHRLLLTRDPPAVQLQVTTVVQETIRAAVDHLQQQRANRGKEDEGEKDSLTGLGEGGDTGELVPGKSLVYAAMELLVFILVRHIPQLNSRVKESPSHAPLRPQRLPDESARLVANTVSILAELPSLCSPAGATTILPTVLFLITGVLKETAIKAPDNSVPVPVSAALQGIKTIITSPLAQEESIQTQWTTLIRSSLASVLEYSHPGKANTYMH